MLIKRVCYAILALWTIIAATQCYDGNGEEFTISRVIRQVVFPGENRLLLN